MVKENISKFKAARSDNQLANVGGNQASLTSPLQQENIGTSLVDNDGPKLPMPYKIILMDCNMPMMNGFLTTRLIIDACKEAYCETPYIVALTASDPS